MIIRNVPVDKLNPAAYNPRKDLGKNDSAYKKLERSMSKFGYVEPIIWNERTGNVVGGHQRLKLLIASGVKEIDVSVVNLCPAEEKALNLALNKIEGDWVSEKIPEILKEISAEIDATITGFDQTEIDRLLLSVEDCDYSLPDMGAYVGRFFEEGAQNKPPKEKTLNKAPINQPTAEDHAVETSPDVPAHVQELPTHSVVPRTATLAEQRATDQETSATVIVFALSSEQAYALVEYLNSLGLHYRVEP